MEPTKETPKVSQQDAKLPPQAQQIHANFLSKIWSVVKSIFSYIGHLFATLLHLNTTKKAEDIKAEHPVQGKPAATSDKVDDAAKGVPPLDSAIPKTETPPEKAPPSPPPPQNPPKEKTRAVSKVELFARMSDDEIHKYNIMLISLNLEGLTECAEFGLRLTQDRKLYEARMHFIASIRDDKIKQKIVGQEWLNIIDGPERGKLFQAAEGELQNLNVFRKFIKEFCENLRKNREEGKPPQMNVINFEKLSTGMCSRFPLFNAEDIQLLKELKDVEWDQEHGVYPPLQFIQWLISALIKEASIPLPKTIEEEWKAFFEFEARMKQYRSEYDDIYRALSLANLHRAHTFYGQFSNPFSVSQENKRIISWMCDYHRFDEACPKVEITRECPNNHYLDQTEDYGVWLLPHEIVWNPAKGLFYARIRYIDPESQELLVLDKDISEKDNFIGFPYEWIGENEIDGKMYPIARLQKPLYFDRYGSHRYSETAIDYEAKSAFSRDVLDEMLQKLHDMKKKPG